MATSRSQYANCRLVNEMTIELETEAGSHPSYSGILVTENMLMVIDKDARNLQLYNRCDGKLLSTSDRLESKPTGVCLISKSEVAVCMNDCKIVILSFKTIDDVKLVRILDETTGINWCHSVAKLNSSEKLVVSGVKYDHDFIFYWCVVNLTDGRVDSTHKICNAGNAFSHGHLAIKDNTIYISCPAPVSAANGVYAYDIFNPHTQKFLYQHHHFLPYSITVDDRNFIYVCSQGIKSIHQLTDSGQLVTIHTVSSRPWEIFYDDHYRVMYTTTWDRRNVITVFRPEYLHEPASVDTSQPHSTSDTDRFMRITYLLVDVGSRILRKLLWHHTVTPTLTLDQYLANNRDKINSLLKRKVLHQSQMDILFPPSGANTNIDDYNVTLLSALLNNIVSGLNPQEENMITCLREDRNTLYGHARLCKMNAGDYQTCWNIISSTLTTLSQHCGDPNFQNEMVQEIQRTYFSAIPTGSYLDILRTWCSKTETAEGSLETVQGSLETFQGSLETVQGSLETVKVSLETVKGSLETVKGSLETVKGSLETVRVSLETVGDAIKALTARVEALELKKADDES